MAIPKILVNFDLYLQGKGHRGKAEEVTLPTLSLKTEEYRNAGQDIPIDRDMGMNKLEMSFKLSEHSVDVYRNFGLANGNSVQVQFRGVLVDDTSKTPYIITGRGMYTEVTPGTVSVGGKNPMEAKLSLRYYRVDIGGVEQIEIDADNGVRRIGGVDQNAEVNSILDGA